MRLVERLQAEVALVHDAVIVFVLLILVELGERRGDVVWLGIGDDRQRRSAQVGPGGVLPLLYPWCRHAQQQALRSLASTGRVGGKKSSLALADHLGSLRSLGYAQIPAFLMLVYDCKLVNTIAYAIRRTHRGSK